MSSSSTRPGIDTLLNRLGQSDLDDDSVDRIAAEVERICTAYSTADPADLSEQTQAQLREIDRMLDQRLGLGQQRALFEAVGWLALVLAALSYDQGDTGGAEQSRQLALRIGEQLDSTSILGWAHETDVWTSVATGDWAAAVHKADTGLAVSGEDDPTGVGIQLALQRAQAAAQLQDTELMRESLKIAERLLNDYAPPPNPQHHFRFDHAKYHLRKMRILLVIGDDDEAEPIARRLLEEAKGSSKESAHPMRTSEILITLALTAARRGEIAEAVELANKALDISRRSTISLRQLTAGLAAELERHLEAPGVRSLLARREEMLVASDA